MESSDLVNWGSIAIIVFMVVLGVVQQGGAQSEVRAQSTVAFEYFPAQYVNQGNDTEEAIATF